MSEQNTMGPLEIVHKMMDQDAYSQWLGIVVLEAQAGQCRLHLRVGPAMCNGFGIAHGGISYALADSALAFASNAHGYHAFSVDTSITHLKKVQVEDELTATATQLHQGHTVGHYEVLVHNQHQHLVARFSGTVQRSKTPWT